MPVFEIRLRGVGERIAVVASEYETIRDPRRSRGGNESSIWFKEYAGVIVDRFVHAWTGNLNPYAPMAGRDYFVPLRSIASIFCLYAAPGGAGYAVDTTTEKWPFPNNYSSPKDSAEGTEANLYLVCLKGTEVGLGSTYDVSGVSGAGAFKSPAFPLFVAHSFTTKLKSQPDYKHHSGSRPRAIESCLHWQGYRGQGSWAWWEEGYGASAPSLVSGEGDYYIPWNQVAAIFRVKNDPWA